MSQTYENVAGCYLYRGRKVGIVRDCDVPEELLDAVITKEGGRCLLPAETLEAAGLETESTYFDSYAGEACSAGMEIDFGEVVNFENEQRLISVWETVKNLKENELVRRFKTFTDSFFEWTSDASEFVGKIGDALESGADEADVQAKLEELRDDWKTLLREQIPDDFESEDVAYTFDELLKEGR